MRLLFFFLCTQQSLKQRKKGHVLSTPRLTDHPALWLCTLFAFEPLILTSLELDTPMVPREPLSSLCQWETYKLSLNLYQTSTGAIPEAVASELASAEILLKAHYTGFNAISSAFSKC